MGFGKDGKGVIIREDSTQNLDTLAAQTGIIMTGGSEVGANLVNRFRIIKTRVMASIGGATFSSGDGPIEIYLVDGDLSLAEFEESITGAGPLGPNDRISAERSERFSMLMGSIAFIPQNTGPGAMLNQGIPIEKVIRWTFAPLKGWNWIAFNRGSPLTTGSTLAVTAKHFGVWVT